MERVGHIPRSDRDLGVEDLSGFEAVPGAEGADPHGDSAPAATPTRRAPGGGPPLPPPTTAERERSSLTVERATFFIGAHLPLEAICWPRTSG
jgi:hypothetical protein